MSDLRITTGPFEFVARLEEQAAPQTCEAFGRLLPFEKHNNFPASGEMLLYPGRYSETGILFPYGGTRFASIVGQFAGNHFLTITEGREHLRELGRIVL